MRRHIRTRATHRGVPLHKMHMAEARRNLCRPARHAWLALPSTPLGSHRRYRLRPPGAPNAGGRKASTVIEKCPPVCAWRPRAGAHPARMFLARHIFQKRMLPRGTAQWIRPQVVSVTTPTECRRRRLLRRAGTSRGRYGFARPMFPEEGLPGPSWQQRIWQAPSAPLPPGRPDLSELFRRVNDTCASALPWKCLLLPPTECSPARGF